MNIEIPISDLAIREAGEHATDGDLFYLQTMAPILHYCPGITPDAYWNLTVAEHQFIVDWIIQTGLIKPKETDGGT